MSNSNNSLNGIIHNNNNKHNNRIRLLNNPHKRMSNGGCGPSTPLGGGGGINSPSGKNPITVCLLKVSPRFWMGAVAIISLSQLFLWGVIQNQHAELLHHRRQAQQQQSHPYFVPNLRRGRGRQCTSSAASLSSSSSSSSSSTPIRIEPWPLAGDSSAPRSATSNLKCGSASSSPYGKFLRKHTLWKKHSKLHKRLVEHEECPDVLVVLGVALETYQVETIIHILEGQLGRPDRSSSNVTTTSGLSRRLLKTHGRCFFLFVRENDMDIIRASRVVDPKGSTPETVLLGHIWILPLPDDMLPYSNSAHNELIIKYTASTLWFPPTIISPNASLIWQDVDLIQTNEYWAKQQPRDYRTISQTDGAAAGTSAYNPGTVRATVSAGLDSSLTQPCITVYGTPVLPKTYGQKAIQRAIIESSLSSMTSSSSEHDGNNNNNYYYHPQFMDRCHVLMEEMISKLRDKVDIVESSISSVLLHQQCRAYWEQQLATAAIAAGRRNGTKISNNEASTSSSSSTSDGGTSRAREYIMNQALVDPSIIVWNRQDQHCQDFAATFQCTMLDELLQCHTATSSSFINNNNHSTTQNTNNNNINILHEQVAWPFVVLATGLEVAPRGTPTNANINNEWTSPTRTTTHIDSRRQNIDFVLPTDVTVRGDDIQRDSRSWSGSIWNRMGLSDTPRPAMVRTIRSACHWTVSPQPLGHCPYHQTTTKGDFDNNNNNNNNNNNKIENSNNNRMVVADKQQPISLAIVVAGSSQRFLFNSTVHHVMKSLIKKSQKQKKVKGRAPRQLNHPILIDYFGIITLQAGPAFRQDAGYMGHLTYDPLFYNFMTSPTSRTGLAELDAKVSTDNVTATDLDPFQDAYHKAVTGAMDEVTKTLGGLRSAATLRSLRILPTPLEHDTILDEMEKKQKHIHDLKRSKELALSKHQPSSIVSNGDGTTFDMYDSFPMMDDRPKAVVRTRAGNKNMVRLFLALETLWKEDVLVWEHAIGKPYDYVLIVRDDTLWLDNFDLDAILATNPDADAYILSCDARDPAMLEPEINDHGVLIKRAKADVLGQYLTSMVRTDLQACHASVSPLLGKGRGCNSEMILQHILKVNDIDVQLVPQSILPFERAVMVEHMDGTKEHCYHKFCQSRDSPLVLPSNVKRCHELTFD